MPSKIRDIAEILGVTETANPDNTALGTGGGSLTMYDSIGLLPLSSVDSGSMAFVNSNARMYVNNGVGWYSATIVNNTPTWISEPNASYSVADSATPLVVTVLASDPENIPITYSGTASDSSQYLFSSISQDSSVFTFTPLSESEVDSNVTSGNLNTSSYNSFTYTFKATDGINILSKNVTINYDLAPFPAGYIEYETFETSPSNLVGYNNGSGYPFAVTGIGGSGVTFTTSGGRGLINKNGAYDAGFVKRYSFTNGNTYNFYADGLSLNMGNNRVILLIGTNPGGLQKANLGEWTSNGNQSKTWTADATGVFYVTLRSVTTNTTGTFSLDTWRISGS